VIRPDCGDVCALRTIVENTKRLIAVMILFRFFIVGISVTRISPDVGTLILILKSKSAEGVTSLLRLV
jgi:hypothetical protein